jgi:hypothetical protein
MNADPFRKMAAAMRVRPGFDGTNLNFAKGTWTAGKDVNMNNRELVALVDLTMYGWRKWEDKRPVDYYVGYVKDRFQPPKRSQLGDNDSALWDHADRDPWQLAWFLPLIDEKTGELFIYSTPSKGGKDALAALLEAYADHCEQEQDHKLSAQPSYKQPIVTLKADSYPHPKFSSQVIIPVLDIIRWVDPPDFPKLKAFRPPTSVSALLAPDTKRIASAKELDDEIDDQIPY